MFVQNETNFHTHKIKCDTNNMDIPDEEDVVKFS
jgi:transcriptional regulator of NAD metabolism